MTPDWQEQADQAMNELQWSIIRLAERIAELERKAAELERRVAVLEQRVQQGEVGA